MDRRMDHNAAARQIDPLRYIVQVNRIAAIVGLAFFSVAVALTWWMVVPYVPASKMQPWLWFSISFLALWLILAAIFIVRRPDDSERVRVWSPIAIFIRVTSNIVVLATIWLFLPHLSRDLQLTMMVFYAAHAPTQLLAMPERGWVNGVGTAAILGSVALFNIIYGGAYATALAIFASAFGAVMVILGNVEARLIGNVMAERRRSDETALKLERALADIAEERDAKTRFIATASHDLGQPIQAANLFFSQMVRASDDTTRAQAADGVRRAFDSAEQLLSHLLGFLRLEADAVDPHRTLVSLGQTMERVVAQFKPVAETHTVTLRATANSIMMMTDRTLLERALGNLVDNAIRHSSANSILVGARKREGLVELWVLDDGQGVASPDTAQIFDDYFKGTEAVAQTRSGFGLGLASVRRVATLLGGEAGLDPRWRKGAAFFLRLPGLSTAAPHRVQPVQETCNA